MKKRTLLIIGAVVAAVIVFSCIGCLILGAITRSSPTYKATATAQAIAEATEAARPTATPRPTDTPTPPSPPTEAPTPTPALLTCEDIEKKRKELTDLQWEAYRQEVVGERIRFAGEVVEVYDDGRVQIRDGKGLFTVCMLHEVPRDAAITLTKGQFVQGEGTVREVDTLLGLTVRVNVESLQSPTETKILSDTPVPPAPTPSLPTATPTPSLPQLEILSHQSYVDDGWFHIVGEVRNNSDTPMEFVKIVATLYDDAGQVVGTDFTYTEIDVIPPGGKSPFETGTDEWEGATNYKLQVQGNVGTLPRQDIVILGHSHYADSGWLHVRGEVQNTGDTPAEFVKIVVTLYDAAGNVVGTDFTYTDLDVVPAGGTSPFETGTDHWPNFDYYEIQVQAQ